jgi:hypothetical protein
MTDQDEHITAAQEWLVRFTSQGKEVFQSIGGSPQLSNWSFRVLVPAKDGRTEKDLVEEIRSLGVEKIHQECLKDGLQISPSDLQPLNSHEYLNGSKL